MTTPSHIYSTVALIVNMILTLQTVNAKFCLIYTFFCLKEKLLGQSHLVEQWIIQDFLVPLDRLAETIKFRHNESTSKMNVVFAQIFMFVLILKYTTKFLAQNYAHVTHPHRWAKSNVLKISCFKNELLFSEDLLYGPLT